MHMYHSFLLFNKLMTVQYLRMLLTHEWCQDNSRQTPGAIIEAWGSGFKKSHLISEKMLSNGDKRIWFSCSPYPNYHRKICFIPDALAVEQCNITFQMNAYPARITKHFFFIILFHYIRYSKEFNYSARLSQIRFSCRTFTFFWQ